MLLWLPWLIGVVVAPAALVDVGAVVVAVGVVVCDVLTEGAADLLLIFAGAWECAALGPVACFVSFRSC